MTFNGVTTADARYLCCNYELLAVIGYIQIGQFFFIFFIVIFSLLPLRECVVDKDCHSLTRKTQTT